MSWRWHLRGSLNATWYYGGKATIDGFWKHYDSFMWRILRYAFPSKRPQLATA